MPDFKKSFPDHKPFDCCAAWHLRKSGLYLATYDFIGGLTAGGKREFFSSIEKTSKYFNTNYETQRRVFKGLTKQGWFDLTVDGNHLYVPHKVWAKKYPGKCSVRAMLAWQHETDPFVGLLYGIAGGKFKAWPNFIVGLKKLAPEKEILRLFEIAMKDAALSKQAGTYEGTAPVSCLSRVQRFLRQQNKVAAEKLSA